MNILYKFYCRTYQTIFRFASYALPWHKPEIISGSNSMVSLAQRFKEKGVRRALLVTDAGILKLRLEKTLINAMNEQGIDIEVYGKTIPNPTIANIEEALALYKSSKCNALIALGGGSPIDCAKGVGARLSRPGKRVQKMRGQLKVLKRIPLLVAIPTTAGSGSETTVAAVITDGDTHEKYAINDPALIPQIAVLAPELTSGLPASFTAATGVDALTHAIEAYIGRSNTGQTRSDAVDATKLIFANLRKACRDGKDLKARMGMQEAAYLAGRAFTRAYVGNVHAIAHTLGGQYSTAHGLANAVILPYVLEAYGKTAHKALSKLAKAVNIGKDSMKENERAQAFIEAIRKLNSDTGIPDKLDDLKVEDIPLLVSRALREANPLYPVPRIFDEADMINIYRSILVHPAKKKADAEAAKAQHSNAYYESIMEAQQIFFSLGSTKSVAFRKKALRSMGDWLKANEKELLDVLYADLRKAPFEAYATEIGIVHDEIKFAISHLRRWSRDKRVLQPIKQFPSRCFVRYEPFGVTLIMSPWNYPLMLTLAPLVGAIAAGNCVVVKPSAYSPNTSAVISKMVREVFDPSHVAVVEGGRKENKALLSQRFDFIFFTGSATVGKEVMAAAAPNLTPVCLELGGKSPCIVDETANIKLAARRIVWGKFINSGQTCVAPDYMLVHHSVKDKLIDRMIKEIKRSYGEKPCSHPDYPRMINAKHYERVLALMNGANKLCGGESVNKTLQIAPTIIDNVTWKSPSMREEIFGPLMPVMTYDKLDEVVTQVRANAKPLALYLFTKSKANEKRILKDLSFGGGCINDTVVHLATPRLPFGGVGESGMGGYHGRWSFETFSHKKSIMKKALWLDMPLRYPPYKKIYLALLRKL